MKKSNSRSKIMTIISHEYLTKVKSKGFIIATILGPLLMLAVIAVPVAVALLSGNDTEKRIAVLDKTELEIGKKIVSIDSKKFFIADRNESKLREQVLSEELDGFLIIPEDVIQSSKVTVFTRGGGGLGFISSIDMAASKVIRIERLKTAGADTNVIALVEKGVDVQTQKITQKGTEKDYTEVYAGVGYILGFVIYMMMLMYGSFVMRGVIEEKANRIVEVLASSAKPFDIMFGKVVGIGAVGLTQVLFWVLIAAVLMAVAGPLINMLSPGTVQMAKDVAMSSSTNPQMQIPAGFEMPSVPVWLFVAFIFYFLSGYFIYSTLFAAVGSAVDQEQDAQQLMTPIMLPIIIPILLVTNVISNPDGILAIVLSLFLLFTPILMIVRVAATDVPFWQIATSVILLIATFFGALWLASRIYRTGILMYGKKPNFKDIARWIRLSK